jgi:hypothetical protein
MSKELQLKLTNGVQIIATDIAFYDYSEEIRKQRKQSQHVGDLLMVNNPRVARNKDTGEVLHAADIVSGELLNNLPGESRNRIGLGGSLKVGTFRLATPDDPGYMATREQWADFKDSQIFKLRCESFVFGVTAILTLGALALVVMP